MLKLVPTDLPAVIFPAKQISFLENGFEFSKTEREGFRSLSFQNLLLIIEDISSRWETTGGDKNESLLPVDNTLKSIISILSLWKLNKSPFLLPVAIRADELNKIRDYYGLEVFQDLILNSAKVNGMVDKVAMDLYPEQTAAIIRTSGSEGRASAAEIKFRSVEEHFKLSKDFFDYDKDSKWLLSLPLYHVSGFAILCRALFNQLPLVVPEDNNISKLLSAIEIFGVSHASFVTPQIKDITDQGIVASSRLKKVLVGGGPVSENILITAINNNWPVAKVYGSTETFSFVSAFDVKEHPDKINSVGRPLPGVTIETEKTIGELVISSPTLLSSYYADAEKTKSRLSSGRFFTGDIGEIDEDGFLNIYMRRTDTIISGGVNINPVEIEEQILRTGMVSEVCVTGKQSEKWGEEIVAVVVLADGAVFDEHFLRSELEKKLDRFKIPKVFIKWKKLPKTDIGKIRRSEIKEIINSDIF